MDDRKPIPHRYQLDLEPDGPAAGQPTGGGGAFTDAEGARRERLGRRCGAYGALVLVRRVLALAGPEQTAEILGDLDDHDDLSPVMRRLEDAADELDEGGERS